MSYNCSIYAITSGKDPIRATPSLDTLVNVAGAYEKHFHPQPKKKKGSRERSQGQPSKSVPQWLQDLVKDQQTTTKT